MWTLSGFADEISDDVEEQCAVLRGLGMSHLELRSAWGSGVLDLDDAQLRRAEELLAAHGLGVSSIGSPVGKVHLDADVAAHLDRARRAVDLAHRFGARYVRVFSFFLRPDEAPGEVRGAVLERMAALAEVARSGDVVFLHENEKGIYGDVPQRCADVLEQVGSPHLRAAWDPANFVQVGVRPHTEGYALLRPHLEYVQVKDAHLATGEVVPAGEGDGEVLATVRALREDGFDGFFSLEPHLAHAHALGGFSGPDLFTRAHAAFTGLLRAESISYR
jgi:sugar phosphate isomerase/epimerase